jgi:protein-L-isoaspartate(D-aspartate) O-methyltransferase
MPVGPADGIQKLTRLARTEAGFDETVLADVRFVPLIPGKAAHL